MKKDIFEPVISKKIKPDMVIYEINDSGREREYRTGRSSSNFGYDISFLSFLESLGYELDKVEGYRSDNVMLKDTEFTIDYNNASYASYNIYERKASPRKPQNRYIAIKLPYYNGPTVVRVYINKEIDANVIRAKIEKAIEDIKNKQQERQDMEDRNKNNTQAIYDHYMINADIRTSVNALTIERNTIKFNVLSCVTITTDLNHKFQRIDVWSKQFENVEDWNGYAENFSFDKVRKMIKTITTYKQLSDELITWATDRTVYLSELIKNDTDEK